MSGWSDIALRARATTTIPSAVMYKAHTVLARGRSTVAPGHIWVVGNATDTTTRVMRYISSPANSAHAAHLVSGWKQGSESESMLLGSHDLKAYMGHKPHFWPDTDTSLGYKHMPNSVAGVPAIAFWRDVCASMCFRRYDDDVEMIQVDLRNGLYNGHATNALNGSGKSKCNCYAYEDLAKLDKAPVPSSPSSSPEVHAPVSHEAPNDVAMARFLSKSKLVNNYRGKGTADQDLMYRQFINTYAVHRDPWESYFVVEEQSSIFYRLALESSYYVDLNTLQAYVKKRNIKTLNNCLRECTMNYDSRMDLASVVFMDEFEGDEHTPSGAVNCWCTTKDLLHPDQDKHIIHDYTRTDIKVYRAKLCVGVAGGSERSVVYRKGVKGANAVCMGMPVGSGMILSNGSVFLSRDASDDTRPIDIQCRSACDANPDCALAHSFVSSPLEHLQIRHLLRHSPIVLLLLRRSRPSVCSRCHTRCLLHPSHLLLHFHPLLVSHHSPPCHPRRHPTASLACAHSHLPATIRHPRVPTMRPMHSSTCTVS